MANEPVQPAAQAAAPAPDVAVAPETQSTAPASEAVSAPAEPITTFLDGAPASVEATPAPAADPEAPAPVADPAPNPTPENPVEGDKPPEAKTDQGDKSDEPAPLPVYEPWTLPDDVKLDEVQSGEFSKLLGEFQNTSKAEQALVQKFGQELVTKHVTALNEGFDKLHKGYSNAWQQQTDGWRESFINDPEIGGKRQETTIRLANEFIDTHGGTPESKAAFREVMKNTGLGVHPEVLRLLSNAMNRYSEGKPLPANPPARPSATRPQRMYGKKTG